MDQWSKGGAAELFVCEHGASAATPLLEAATGNDCEVATGCAFAVCRAAASCSMVECDCDDVAVAVMDASAVTGGGKIASAVRVGCIGWKARDGCSRGVCRRTRAPVV